MRKNAFALAFALIGLGIALWLNSDSPEINWLMLAGFVCGGIFVGYFIAGLIGAKSTILQQNFKSLGDLRGKSLDEITSAVGAYSNYQSTVISDRNNAPGHLYTWYENQYSITLLFDADNNCVGVTNETVLK